MEFEIAAVRVESADAPAAAEMTRATTAATTANAVPV
jgi:hypothetical protein